MKRREKMAISRTECEMLLQEGLYKKYSIERGDSFSSDFKRYLISDTFKSDLKNGKWGGSITVPINGTPVTLGANADKTTVSAFQTRIQEDTSFSMRSDDYLAIHSSVPDIDLATKYVDCVTNIDKIESERYGFQVKATADETTAQFFIEYKPFDITARMPKLESCTVINGIDVKVDAEVGQVIRQRHLVICGRDKKKSLRLIFNTDLGTAMSLVPGDPPPAPLPIPPISEPSLQIKSSGQLSLVANDLTSGAGNVGSRRWKVSSNVRVEQVWYVVAENIVDLAKFDKIIVRPDGEAPDTVIVDFQGVNQRAAINVELFAAYTKRQTT